MAIVIVSEEIEEMIALVDRVITLAAGQITAEFAGEEIDHQAVLTAMFPIQSSVSL